MKKVFMAVAVLTLLIGVFTTQSFACEGLKGDSGISDKFFKKAYLILDRYGELQLSDEQISKIKQLKNEVKKELIRKDADLEVLNIDFRSAMHQANMDVKALNALADKKFDVQKKKMKFFIKSIADLKGILNEEQLTKLKEFYTSGKMCAKGSEKDSFCPLKNKGSGKDSVCPLKSKGSMKKGSGK